MRKRPGATHLVWLWFGCATLGCDLAEITTPSGPDAGLDAARVDAFPVEDAQAQAFDGAAVDSAAQAGSDSGAPTDGATPPADAAARRDAEASTTPQEDAASPELSYPRPVFPVPDSQGACPDAPLRIRFTAPPRLGDQGRVRVFDADSPQGPPVAELDMAQSVGRDVIGGAALNVPRKAYVDENDAVFYLPRQALSRGKRYFVTVEPGVLSASDGTPFTITESSAWAFATETTGPAQDTTLTVALDGSGDFCTLQSAIEAVPEASERPVSISLAAGTYHEIVRWERRSHITLHGEGRDSVIISGVNNERLNPGTQNRALVGIDSSSDVTVRDLTIHNLTPQGGSQAEALRMQRCDRCSVRRARIRSLQDTLLWSGRIYAEDCLIEGNVDYVWGTGAAYFKRCELRTKGRPGYILQARNPASTHGYVFVECRLTADAGVSGDILARVDANVYPASQVAFIDCEMGAHIDAQGWLVTGTSFTPDLRFSEYGSVRPDGSPVNVSGRKFGTQLSTEQAENLRDPQVVLDGWQPD